jgi:peptide/nickel transport system substrate-binding protein
MDQTRRRILLTGAAAGLTLPRIAIGQANQRPAITIAVQKISNSNTLDDLREQSNVGTRMACFLVERLIDLDYQGALEQKPGLATSWRRIDERTLEATLRPGVRFHNGDVLNAEDVAFSFGPQRMMGTTRPTVQGKTLPLSGSLVTTARVKELPQEVPPVARRLWPALDRVEVVDAQTVRFVNATPDVTLEGG